MGLLSSLFDSRLHSAVRRGDAQKVEQLLANGASVDEESLKRTPLLLAARGANLSMVKLLLDKGANLEATDSIGSTPLMVASGGWDYKGEDKEVRCVEVVEVLLKRGADPNACGKRGQTALRHALGAGNRQVMRLLREHGAADYWYDSVMDGEGAQWGARNS